MFDFYALIIYISLFINLIDVIVLKNNLVKK